MSNMDFLGKYKDIKNGAKDIYYPAEGGAGSVPKEKMDIIEESVEDLDDRVTALEEAGE